MSDAAAPPTGSRAARVARAVGKKLVALGIGLTISFLLAECTMRIVGIGSPVFARPDGRYGLVLIPGTTGWYRAEGKGWVSINSVGMRDVEHAVTKPPGTYRIAILGDSYAEALQVSRDQAFWAVMGKQLGGCAALGGAKVEVLNFGVSGYSQTQELMVLQDKVWRYQPDLVLLAVLTGNDISDNVPELTSGRPPFFHVGERGELTLDTSRTHKLGRGGELMLWLIRHSRVFQLANSARLNLAQCGKLGACYSPEGAGAGGEAGLRNQVYLPPTDAAWTNAWRVTEALIDAIRDDVAAHHARLLLATLSNGIQVHPDPAVRAQFRAAIGSPDLLYPDKRVAEIAARAGIPSLALAPVLAAHAESTHTYLHGWPGPGLGKGHWNPDGHRVAGEALATWVCQTLAPAPAPAVAPPPVAPVPPAPTPAP